MCVWNANVCANVYEVQMCVQNALRFWDCMVYIGQFENKWPLYNTEPLIHEHGIYRLISPNILQFLCRFISHSSLDVSLGVMILLCNLFFKCLLLVYRATLVAQWWRIHLPILETWVWSLGQEALLMKEMASHSSILAWEIPWTEEPGGLQSMGLQRVGCYLVTQQQRDKGGKIWGP